MSVTVLKEKIDLAQCQGVAGLAQLCAGLVLKANDLGVTSFYAWPGGIAVGEGPEFLDAARNCWHCWRDRLRSILGNPTTKRGLRATDDDLNSQLAWRGLLILDGVPQPWRSWTLGARPPRYPVEPPSQVQLQQIAGVPVSPAVPLLPAVPMPLAGFSAAGPEEALLEVLSRGSSVVAGFTLISASDLSRASREVWEIDTSEQDSYIVMRGSGGRERLHSFIKGSPGPGMSLDHRNRNRWDNRRASLAPATPTEQANNRRVRRSAGYSLCRGGWEVRLRHGGISHYQRFATEGEAAARVEEIRATGGSA